MPTEPAAADNGPATESADQIGRVPRQRTGEADECIDPDDSESNPPATCCTGRPGWAGGHQHGAVRPRRRSNRRQRPPGRWC